MKKIISLMAGFVIASCALSGCVDDPPNVVLKSIATTGSCSATSDNGSTLAGCNPKFDDNNIMIGLSAQVMNYIPGSTPWSSSGGSSGGSTFETTIVNPGLIYIDKIKYECVSVGGSKDGCKGWDSVSEKTNIPVSGSGGGACIPLATGILQFLKNGSGDDLQISIQVFYHDSSLISEMLREGRKFRRFPGTIREKTKW